jgi:hypothetical protein
MCHTDVGGICICWLVRRMGVHGPRKKLLEIVPNIFPCRLCIIVTNLGITPEAALYCSCRLAILFVYLANASPFCGRKQNADFIVYDRRISATKIWHLILDGRFEVALDSETLGIKPWCLTLITRFAILIFADYSKYKELNLTFCGQCIVI